MRSIELPVSTAPNVPRDFFQDNVRRYRQVIRGQRPDFAPVRCWLDNYFCCQVAGVPAEAWDRDFETQLSIQQAVNARFCNCLDFSVGVDYSDIWFDHDKFRADQPDAPAGRFLERSLDDFDRYHVNRPFDQIPGVQRLHEGIAFFNARLPAHKRVCHYLGVWGNLDLFAMARGTENCFTDLYDNPRQVHRIFSYLTERNLQWLEYVQKHWGGLNDQSILFDKLDIGEDYCAYLSSELFDEFVVPYTGRLFAAYKGRALCSLHTDGDMRPADVPRLAKLGIEEFMGFSPRLDIGAVRQSLPDTVLAGNIHPINVMINGTPADVKAAARHCFEAAGQNGRYVLCTGGGIGGGTKPENVDALLEAAYEICRY